MAAKLSTHTQVICDLVSGVDTRASALQPGFDLELAHLKTIFLTDTPRFPKEFSAIAAALEAMFADGDSILRMRVIRFMLGAAESLAAPVELDHNLRNESLFPGKTLSDSDLASVRALAAASLQNWAAKDGDAFHTVTSEIKAALQEASRGVNPFAWHAARWQKRNGRDPYASPDDYVACFGALYHPGVYYPDLYFARAAGLTSTQFTNDGGELTGRCRRLGCTGAIMGRSASMDDVLAAMLSLRSIFLIEGLGFVSHSLISQGDAESFVESACEVHQDLAVFARAIDEILLDGSAAVYVRAARKRVGVPNSAFNISVECKDVPTAVMNLNFGKCGGGAVCTNVTGCLTVGQLYAASLATEQGVSRRKGTTVDGSTVSVSLSQLSDAIRKYRIEALVAMLPATSRFKSMDASGVANLREETTNNIEFIKQLEEIGVEFKPGDEEDAISHAGMLCVKRASALLRSKLGGRPSRLLTTDKPFYFQETELLGVGVSAHSPRLQQTLVRMSPVEVEDWDVLYADMDEQTQPVKGSLWAGRLEILAKIWPQWQSVWEIKGR